MVVAPRYANYDEVPDSKVSPSSIEFPIQLRIPHQTDLVKSGSVFRVLKSRWESLTQRLACTTIAAGALTGSL